MPGSMHNHDQCNEDRRAFGRVTLWLDSRISNRSKASRPQTNCRLINLSFGGAKLLVPRKTDNDGDVIEVYIPLVNRQGISLRARIVRSAAIKSKQVLAVKFDRIPNSKRHELHRVLTSYVAKDAGTGKSAPLSPYS